MRLFEKERQADNRALFRRQGGQSRAHMRIPLGVERQILARSGGVLLVADVERRGRAPFTANLVDPLVARDREYPCRNASARRVESVRLEPNRDHGLLREVRSE